MNRTVGNYAKARLQLERDEATLRRAFRKWEKQRAKVLRYEKRLDRAQLAGGSLNWTDLAKAEESENDGK